MRINIETLETITSIVKNIPYTEEGVLPKPIEYVRLWVLFLATILVIYLLPQVFNYVFFLILFVLFARSNRDYLWLAYIILLNYPPFGFFTEGSREAAYRLPLFSFGAGLSFSAQMIFLFIGLVKAFLRKNKVESYFVNHYRLLLLYLALLAAIALIAYKPSIGVFVDGVKNAFNLAFIFIIYKLIVTREDKYKFLFILLPAVFLILLDACYFLITGGDYIYNLFNPANPRRVLPLGIEATGEINIRFVLMGFHLSYLIFIFSLSYSFLSKNKSYFLLAALSAFIAIMAAALRSWFVIYSFALFFFLIYGLGKMKHNVTLVILFLLLILPIIQTTTGSATFSGAFQRISTVFTLGEESSAATQQISAKITRRLPQQLEYIQENPVTGWAFTEKQGDIDVGNIALIVEVGFVGFFIFLWFWFTYINILRKHIDSFGSKDAKRALKMLIVLFLGMLLSHFTTNAVFMIYMGVFMGTLVFITEFIIEEAKIYDKEYGT